MEKGLTLGSLGVAGVLLLFFALDLFTGIPFGGGSAFGWIDVIGLIAGGILGYLAFNAYRDVR